MPIDRPALVQRHTVHLQAHDARNPLTVGNGDFAYTADITGMQTFRDAHDPTRAEAEGRQAVDTCTMSTWGWHSMPNPDGYELADAMTTYQTPRGPVSYPDRLDLPTLFGHKDVTDDSRAAMWLHVNPQRIDLGRIGLSLMPEAGAEPETDPQVLDAVDQRLDLWTGTITSTFRYGGEDVVVTTVADQNAAAVAFRIRSRLLTQQRLAISFTFAYPSDSFGNANSWDRPERHTTELVRSDPFGATFHRQLDETTYLVRASWNSGHLTTQGIHAFTATTDSDVFELVVEFASDAAHLRSGSPTVDEVTATTGEHWEAFWRSGAAVDLAASTDPRAQELERRIVLSQYLTAVNCAGEQPPQETGLVTNSWQGKFHLEMHWWHAAHFATWGRPELLARSIGWYESVLDVARATAARQGYAGARWPKQVGPDGRESPTDIGSFLIWQQPHLIYFAELLHRAGVEQSLLDRLSPLVHGTAEFMASYAEQRPDGFHLPSPLMPAQEFYDPATTEDPTYELAYWWWALNVAQQWRQRAGHDRDPAWDAVLHGLVAPTVQEGNYTAIGTAPLTRVDDHPSMLAALGFLPQTPLIDPAIIRATRHWVGGAWDWDSAWGWDFPVLAMNATRTGDPQAAVDALLMNASKNTFLINGHNPQMGNMLPIYLPGNGGLLAAVSLMCAGWDSCTDDTPGFPTEGWTVLHEGFTPWP